VISFRYHLVSIIAVFLALALGIVVGTTALNGPITKDLRRQLNDAKHQRDNLNGQVKQLQNQIDDAGQFAATYGDQLLAGSLAKQNIVEIVLPGASSDMQDGIDRDIKAAGGTISGRLTITQAYLDPSRGSGIVSLATGAAHPFGWTAPPTSDPAQLGGSLLAYVLLGKGEQTDLTQVLGGFSELHMVSLGGRTVTPAKTVIVLGSGGGQGAKNHPAQTELALVGALAAGGGHVVVAGDADSASKGGLVGQVRATKADRDAVTTVDDADNAFGQVSAVLALGAATKGQVGHFGTQEGADALYPAPAK
jgi:hypothetical protein